MSIFPSSTGRQGCWCRLAALLTLLLLVGGCATPPAVSRATFTQVSAIDALLAGSYDGQMTLAELRQSGNFGIGTFHALDGEMILLDGEFYQARADGHIYRPAPSVTTPFASVVNFAPEKSTALAPGADWAALIAAADALVADPNALCAVRVRGTFRHVKIRSVPAQKQPYPPLVEVAKTQPVYERAEVRGTLVGFRAPPFVKGINVPGYHLHFLSDDRQFGGHVLALTLESGTLEVAGSTRLQVLLPTSPGALAGLDLKRDRTHELEKVEK
ncbi:MAG: acetolactate decarboxylase [Opitutae bacterium]|nr:acetolactate decarboxylase [Opitutae bacterium]